MRILLAAICVAGLLSAAVRPASAEPARGASTKPARRQGHPTVKLDRLEFPDDIPGAHYFKKHLRRALRHDAYHADWGAGRGTTIEYRFFVRELSLETQDGVLHVRCTAYGKLPSGKTAKSHLEFGGSPSKRNKIVRRVLEIVSRGVITRLAEMERVRRGDLRRRRVRAPH
jgi:hypothetical protein